MLNLTLAALLASLTYTGSDYAQDFIQQDNNVLVGDFGNVALDTSIPDYYLEDLATNGQLLTFDLRDVDRYPNFISFSFSKDTNYYYVNFNINYGINFYLSYELNVGTFNYSATQIPLWPNDGYYNQIAVPLNQGSYFFIANMYFTYVGDTSNYNDGYAFGYDNGYQTGFNDGTGEGYQKGYSDGFADADNQDAVAVTIFSGILSVGLLPVNFFLAILNFEVFGINIGAFVSALLTVAIVVIVTRMVVNGGNGKD